LAIPTGLQLKNNKHPVNKILGFWRKFKAFFGHRLILELAILGSFIAYTINPGSLGDLMRICGTIFLFNVLIGNYRIGDVTEGHLVVLVIFLITLLINGFMPDEMIHRRSFRYFLTIPGMILAIHCLSKRTHPDSRTLKFYCSIAVLALTIQFIAYHTVESVVNSGGLESYGLSGNMHHFGSFAGLILPVLLYFSTQIKGWLRLLCVVGVIAAFYLLWESSSRISWFAFFSSILIAILLFLRNRKLLIGLAGFFTISFIAALVSGLAAIKIRIMDILSNWRTEERVTVWADTLDMLGNNSVKDWLFGHGIGSFRYYFPDYNTFKVDGKVVDWNFPHNVFFQIIFENGSIGLVTILGGMVLLMIGIWRGFHQLEHKNDRYLLVTLFILFWINLIHCALTLSFYHKYFIYPLSMIIGILLILLEKTGQNKPLQSLNWFQSCINFLTDKMPALNRWLPKRKIDA
jgi:O-antigen ligase